MELSRKSHAIELSLFLWRAMPNDATATINHLHAPVTALMFGCSGIQFYNTEVRDEGSDQPWDNDRMP